MVFGVQIVSWSPEHSSPAHGQEHHGLSVQSLEEGSPGSFHEADLDPRLRCSSEARLQFPASSKQPLSLAWIQAMQESHVAQSLPISSASSSLLPQTGLVGGARAHNSGCSTLPLSPQGPWYTSSWKLPKAHLAGGMAPSGQIQASSSECWSCILDLNTAQGAGWKTCVPHYSSNVGSSN